MSAKTIVHLFAYFVLYKIMRYTRTRDKDFSTGDKDDFSKETIGCNWGIVAVVKLHRHFSFPCRN